MSKPSDTDTFTAAIERARAAWRFRGGQRPDFAIEPGPDQESVWDYPRPPAIVPESRRVEVRAAERLLARSDRAVRVCETGSPPTLYLPPDDICMDRLAASPTQSFCEWKGQARYFQLKDAAEPAVDVAWSYPEPLAGFEQYAGWLCFYPGRVACFFGRRAGAAAGRRLLRRLDHPRCRRTVQRRARHLPLVIKTRPASDHIRG